MHAYVLKIKSYKIPLKYRSFIIRHLCNYTRKTIWGRPYTAVNIEIEIHTYISFYTTK